MLAVAAAFADGTTEVSGAAELRVKESDRVATTVSQLAALGVSIREREDGMIIEGGRGLSGGNVRSFGDHRLAMALAAGALAGSGDVRIADADAVAISYPAFWQHLEELSR